MKGLSKTTKKLVDRDNSMVMTRGKGKWGQVEEDKGGINGDERKDLTLGDEHTIQYTDDVL